MPTNEWHFVSVRFDLATLTGWISSQLGRSGDDLTRRITLPNDINKYIYKHDFLGCVTTVDREMLIPLWGDIGSLYIVEGPLSNMRYMQLIEHVRSNSPQYDYPSPPPRYVVNQ